MSAKPEPSRRQQIYPVRREDGQWLGSVGAGRIVAVLLAAALVLAILFGLYYPAIPRGVLGWVLFFVIGVPAWLLLEWLGRRIVEWRFFSRLGRAARIAMAVPVLVLFMILAGYIIHLVQGAIGGR